MHLPIDYRRINQLPEWFAVVADKRCVIHRVSENTDDTRTGQELHGGVSLDLKSEVGRRTAVGHQAGRWLRCEINCHVTVRTRQALACWPAECLGGFRNPHRR